MLWKSLILAGVDDDGLIGDTLPGSMAPDPCCRNPLHGVSRPREVRRQLCVELGSRKTGLDGRVPVDIDPCVLEFGRHDVEGICFQVLQILGFVDLSAWHAADRSQ
jgi:hypothetical protein